MRRFRFRPEALLRVRRLREEQAESDLALARRRHDEEVARGALLAAELSRWREGQARARSGGIDVGDFLAGAAGEEALQADIDRQSQRIEAADAAVAEAADELRRRRVDREVLEQLRDQRLAAHRRALASEEQQALDDAAVLRFRASAAGPDREGA